MAVNRLKATGRNLLSASWAPVIVLATSLAFTFVATAVIASSARERDRARFRNAVESASDRIQDRLDIYITALRGGVAFMASSDNVTNDDFRRYVDELDISRLHPGIQGIGWSPRVEIGREGAPDRFEIRYLEPMDARNQEAIGYDMFSEPTRREAMMRARDTGRAAMSGRVRLVQEIPGMGPPQPGFLIYLPLYRDGVRPATVEERRDLLEGFVYAPFRAGDLFDGIFGSEADPRVRFLVYDGDRPDATALLHASSPAADERPDFSTVMHMEVGGRPWTVVFESRPIFEEGSSGWVLPSVFVGGLLASVMLALLAWSQARARRAAEVASRARGAFLATMSHELRTPLNAIGGFADLMMTGIGGDLTPRHREYVLRMQRAQRHLLGLINDVLNLARLDSGRVSYRREIVRVRDVVTEAEQMMAPAAEARDIRYSSTGGPDVRAIGDLDKIRQVLINLFSNAIKFTEAGGRISIGWETEPGVVLIHVTDTGIGIETSRMEEIFEPFVQVDQDLTRARQGTGLGLAISRQLARGMGGDITVTSRPGAGSTFTLRLTAAAD